LRAIIGHFATGEAGRNRGVAWALVPSGSMSRARRIRIPRSARQRGAVVGLGPDHDVKLVAPLVAGPRARVPSGSASRVSVAAKKGTSLAVEKEPVVGLRYGLHVGWVEVPSSTAGV